MLSSSPLFSTESSMSCEISNLKYFDHTTLNKCCSISLEITTIWKLVELSHHYRNVFPMGVSCGKFNKFSNGRNFKWNTQIFLLFGQVLVRRFRLPVHGTFVNDVSHFGAQRGHKWVNFVKSHPSPNQMFFKCLLNAQKRLQTLKHSIKVFKEHFFYVCKSVKNVLLWLWCYCNINELQWLLWDYCTNECKFNASCR